MFPYMISHIKESHKPAFEYATKCFASKDPFDMAEKSGAIFDRDRSVIQLKSLGQMFDIQYPEGDVTFSGSNDMPSWNWRWLILHYLFRSDDAPITNQLVSYRELEEGNLNYAAILSKCINPIVKNLLQEPIEQIKAAYLELNASIEEESADICAQIYLFPRFYLMYKLWLGDDEMKGSANILFDANANHYLHTEAVNEASIMVSDFLIKQYELMYRTNHG